MVFYQLEYVTRAPCLLFELNFFLLSRMEVWQFPDQNSQLCHSWSQHWVQKRRTADVWEFRLTVRLFILHYVWHRLEIIIIELTMMKLHTLWSDYWQVFFSRCNTIFYSGWTKSEDRRSYDTCTRDLFDIQNKNIFCNE